MICKEFFCEKPIFAKCFNLDAREDPKSAIFVSFAQVLKTKQVTCVYQIFLKNWIDSTFIFLQSLVYFNLFFLSRLRLIVAEL